MAQIKCPCRLLSDYRPIIELLIYLLQETFKIMELIDKVRKNLHEFGAFPTDA
jgi:hypothetical protein